MSTMAQIQRNQAASGLMPNAAGNFGVDPITGAPVTDKFAAQNLRLPSADTVNTVGSFMARSAPQMLPGRPSRGGGGGGSMGPRRERQKIMRVGPRTTGEYAAENGGLSGQRTSSLDAAYAEGDFSMGGAPRPQPSAQPQQLPGGGYNVPMSAFDSPSAPASGSEVPLTAFNRPEENPQMKPKPMAKGGTMKPNGVYTVGEKGPEMVVPTGDGNMHVIPHGATKKLLSMLPGRPTPRAEGGTLELVQPMGEGTVAQRGFDMGPGQRGFATTITGEGADLVAPPPETVMLDQTGRYQIDPTQPGMPLMPDAVSGPWAEPGMPAPDMTAQFDIISRRVASLPGRGAVPVDAAQQAMREKGQLAMANLANIRYEQEQNRVQQDLAMRAERPALGTPTAPISQIPGMPTMRPSTMRNVERQMERFYNTRQGAMYATEQAQQAGQSQQRMQAATTALPIRDANGNILGYTNGLGASLPNPQGTSRQVRRQAEVNGQWMNFFDDGSVEPVAVPGGNAANQPVLAWDGSKVVTLPADTDVANLPYGLTPLPSRGKTTETGGAKVDPAKPAGTATGPVKVASVAEAQKLKPGTVFVTPDGKTKIR